MPRINSLWRYIPSNAVHYDDEEGQARLNKIRERYDKMRNFWSPVFDQARKEDEFIAGMQWDDIIRKERESSGRPMFTFNLLPSFTRQIVNAARQNRPQLRVKPVQSDRSPTPTASNQQGTKDYSLADVYQGIWRHIEHVSRASQAYDTALTHAVWHSFGFFMLNTRECLHDPFEQELVIERVKDSYSVIVDPAAQMADFSDMADAFVFTRISKDTFRELYPDHTSGSFNVSVEAGLFGDWFDRDSLQIGTYWWVDYVDDKVVKMNDGRVHYMSDISDVLDEWAAQGRYIARDHEGKQLVKSVKRPVAKWQRFTALEFLTPEMETPFERVPVFPVLGDEIIVDGRTQYMSAIRDAIDAQKSYNFHRTAAIETLSLQPKAPFILSSEQIKGHEHEWEQANRQTMPYLLYNQTIEQVPPPQRAPPPQPSFAEFNQAQFDAQDIQAIIGIHEASLGAESNERTGRAVLARQRQGANSTYHFTANLGRAIEAAGRVAVQAIPKIYTTERVMRIRLPDDSEDLIVINEETIDQATGRNVISNDISYGKYDVVIDTGPSYQTQREESVDAMLELLRVLPPEAITPVVHLIVENLGFPGSDKVANVLRKLIPDPLKSEDERAADLPKGVVFDEDGQPVHEETGQPWEPPPSPELIAQQEANQIAQARAQAEIAQAQADAAKAQGDTAQAAAKVEQAKADLAEAQLAIEKLRTGGVEDERLTPQDVRAIVSAMIDDHALSPAVHQDVVDERIEVAIREIGPVIRSLIESQMAEVEANEVEGREEKARTRTEDMLNRLEDILRKLSDRPKAIKLDTDKDGIVKELRPVYDGESTS